MFIDGIPLAVSSAEDALVIHITTLSVAVLLDQVYTWGNNARMLCTLVYLHYWRERTLLFFPARIIIEQFKNHPSSNLHNKYWQRCQNQFQNTPRGRTSLAMNAIYKILCLTIGQLRHAAHKTCPTPKWQMHGAGNTKLTKLIVANEDSGDSLYHNFWRKNIL